MRVTFALLLLGLTFSIMATESKWDLEHFCRHVSPLSMTTARQCARQLEKLDLRFKDLDIEPTDFSKFINGVMKFSFSFGYKTPAQNCFLSFVLLANQGEEYTLSVRMAMLVGGLYSLIDFLALEEGSLIDQIVWSDESGNFKQDFNFVYDFCNPDKKGEACYEGEKLILSASFFKNIPFKILSFLKSNLPKNIFLCLAILCEGQYVEPGCDFAPGFWSLYHKNPALIAERKVAGVENLLHFDQVVKGCRAFWTYICKQCNYSPACSQKWVERTESLMQNFKQC